MERVYAFTNENVTDYSEVYDFKDRDVLSVLGSGDHFFTSVLNGARNIDVYDINKYTWIYFVFKYYAIMLMDYEMFYSNFIDEFLTRPENYEFVIKELPNDVQEKLRECMAYYRGSMYGFVKCDMAPIYQNYGKFIPYFYKSEYERLKKILQERELPKFYNNNLIDLPEVLKDKNYDLVLTSNIYQWLGLGGEEGIPKYINILKQINSPLFQAGYCWHVTDEYTSIFEANGYIVDKVISSRPEGFKKDAILTLKNH